MGKSSAKRSMRIQALVQSDVEIKCKKVIAHTGAAYRRAYRVMGKSSAKRSMRVQARIQGDGK